MQTGDCKDVKRRAQVQRVRVVHLRGDLLVDQHDAAHDVIRIAASTRASVSVITIQSKKPRFGHVPFASHAERRDGFLSKEPVWTAQMEGQIHALRLTSRRRRRQEERQVVIVEAAEGDLERILGFMLGFHETQLVLTSLEFRSQGLLHMHILHQHSGLENS